MDEKMTVLFVKHTGHVLAAVTRNADPTGKITAEDLARGGVLVRGLSTGNEQFEVLPAELDVVVVDLDPALLLQPSIFIIDNGQPVQTPFVRVSGVLLTPTSITVTVSVAVPTDTKAWVQVEGVNLGEPRTAEGKIPTGAMTTSLQIQTLDPGTYDVLTLVADRLPDARSLTIP